MFFLPLCRYTVDCPPKVTHALRWHSEKPTTGNSKTTNSRCKRRSYPDDSRQFLKTGWESKFYFNIQAAHKGQTSVTLQFSHTARGWLSAGEWTPYWWPLTTTRRYALEKSSRKSYWPSCVGTKLETHLSIRLSLRNHYTPGARSTSLILKQRYNVMALSLCQWRWTRAIILVNWYTGR